MASPTSKSPKRSHPPSRDTVSNDPPEVVDPIWLLKAIGSTLIAALVCGYLTVCLLFYQGQWQLVLHPSRSTLAPATIAGTTYETVHFGVDESAVPQLTGWWIAAAPASRYAAYSVLYLPSGDGSLADAVPTLTALHALGINIFAFDYRGYGQSAATHPSQRRMTEDAAAAWQYLTVSRAVVPAKIIPFGDGVGAALAAQLAALHSEVPAVVLQSPRPHLIQVVLDDPRTRSLPVHLLFHDRFDILKLAQKLATPKLFLLQQSAAPVNDLTTSAADPKTIATLAPADWNQTLYREQIARFLDQYLH